jgi:hypothetical protein
MPLQKLQFRPGINREVTSYTNEGGWYDCDKVRFTKGFPEKIGGWVKYSDQSLLGVVGSFHQWQTLSFEKLMGTGTTKKYYIEEGTRFNDITPVRATTAAGDVTFSATDGSYLVTVNDVGHGASVGDFVTFTGATGLGGTITADVLNQEYVIVTVNTGDQYIIEARTAGTPISSIVIDGVLTPTYVTANASDTGNGGASAVAAYQIPTSPDVVVSGLGWGAGGWGRNGWGTAADTGVLTGTIRVWSHDNFGEDLIINPRGGGIYYWDRSASSLGSYSRAVALADLPGASNAPTIANGVLVSDRDRHVIALGCDPFDNPGVQDPMLIRFSNQEDAGNWTPTATNTAGSLRIDSGSEIVMGVETRQQVLVYTDVSLYAMQYLGPPFTFGISKISENITVQGAKCAVAADDMVFWMGQSEFYMYNGAVQRIPCSVRSYVFDDFNVTQGAKVVAGLNTAHSEVWWFYPSANSITNDRYVVYNYNENIWYIGSMDRVGWIDRGVFDQPLAASSDSYVYAHETGFDDGSTTPATALTAYVQSSPIDIQDGEQFSLIRRMFPDVTFKNSTAEAPSVDVTLNVRNISNGAYVRSATQTYADNDRRQLNYRLRGRQMSLKIESDDAQMTWRLGSPRVDLRPDGRR